MKSTLLLAAVLAILSAPAAGAGAVVQDHAWDPSWHPLDAVAASIVGRDQGVYVEAADGTVLVSRAAARPVHPASVSKVATTLALVRKFGPEHRFVTTFSAEGCVSGGTLHGDLLVQGDGDPSLVDEDALLVAENLKRAGIERVLGTLHLTAPLTFDWHRDPDGAGLERALSGAVPASAWSEVSRLAAAGSYALASDSPGLPRIQFGSASARRTAVATGDGATVVYRSQPLLSLLKGLNDYSNNIFNVFAGTAGGATAIQAVARGSVPQDLRSEITLEDGAGADPGNRLSPRAAVKLLRSLEQELATSGHTLVDVLPVAGIDQGTLLQRLDSPGEAGRVVGKTGTFGDYGASALVGAIRTRDRGTVYFAVLNHGVSVPQARHRQDRFVRALLQRLDSIPWSYERDDRPAVARAEVSVQRPALLHDAGRLCEPGPTTSRVRTLQ